MKKQQKISLLMASMLVAISTVSYAQDANTNPTANEVNKGNSFERSVTPLLRQISLKKTQLELRKLDRELDKMDEEALKAQLAVEGMLSGDKGEKGGYNPFPQPKGGALPLVAPQSLPQQGKSSALPTPVNMPELGTAANPFEGNSDIKVLMIYGFDDNLHAKVLSGEQGGYVVKKGDVMPNGQTVHNITANYIEVRKGPAKSKGPIQRIFVSTSVPTTTINAPGINPVGGNSGSARPSNDPTINAILAPAPSPGVRAIQPQ